MLEEDWDELFDPWILERGRVYWKQGNVTQLSRVRDNIHAVVLGSEEYEVDVDLDEGMVLEMYCSCPYAEDGSACKHMAAVLFAAEAGKPENGTTIQMDRTDFSNFPWRETLAQLPAEDMRVFLEEIICKDKGLQERLVLRYREQNPQMLLDSWEEQLQEMIRRYSGRRRYIDYTHANDFYNALDDFILERFPDLLESGKIMLAFDLVNLVYRTAMEQGADDSDGGLTMLTDTCENAWHKILAAASEIQQEDIHKWFAEHLIVPAWCFGTDVVEDFLFSYEWKESLLRENLDLLDRMIRKQDVSGYHIRGLLSWREATMRSLAFSEQEIDAFWKQYRDLPFVRERELARYMEAAEYEKAVALLKEEKQRDQDEPWRLKEHSEKLIELYRLMGQEENYQEELCFQVFSCQQQNMDYVKQLRSILPEEAWTDMTEKLLKIPAMRNLNFELLAYDKQWERLFTRIKEEGRLDRLNQYLDQLIRWSPEQVLECYADFLNTAMHRASERGAYGRIISNLIRLQAYPDGGKLARTLAAHWRKQFARRSAMLDELRRAGF